MKITFLGTGTSQGIPVIGCGCSVCQSNDTRDKRLRVSVWIQTDDGKNIVIDTTPDFRQQMLRAQVPDIDAILFTHEHRDHIGGLDDIRPYNFRFNKNIPLYMLPRVHGELKKAFEYIFAANYPGVPMIEVVEIEQDQHILIGQNKIETIGILHGRLPILGYRLGRFAYLTDVKTIAADQLEKLRDLDTLILSALHFEQHHSHLTIPEAVDLVAQINPRRAFFTHFSHQAGRHAELEARLPPHIRLGYDGLCLEV